MNEDTNQLSEAFAAHEHLAPDAGEVMVKAKAIARSIHRRRWAVRATGGAVLASGLVAGGVALPGRAGPSHSHETVSLAAGDSGPSSAPSTPAYTQTQELNAYFAAGYDYNNAVQLGQLWNDSDIQQVKADAGQKLLEGQTLPVTPDLPPEAPINQDVSAFFAAGYTYDDAVTLSKLWHNSSYQAKVEGGKKLLDNEPLPIPPSGPSRPDMRARCVSSPARAAAKPLGDGKVVSSAKGTIIGTSDDATAADAARAAYFAAGYDYNDAVALGNLWNESDPWQVKADAGQKLLDGQTLPIAPVRPRRLRWTPPRRRPTRTSTRSSPRATRTTTR